MDYFKAVWICLVAGLSLSTALHHEVHSHGHQLHPHSHEVHSYPHDSHHYSHDPHSYPGQGRNQRLIKLLSSAFKHHPHHKQTRPGPLGPHYHDHGHDLHYEYIRPNRPPPIPPFVNGPPQHKYLPRPPSYSPYKPSSYGSPYKSVNNLRSPVIKEHIRGPPPAPSFPSYPSKPISPSFEYLPSSNPGLNHIINSDDNRGPIHEIPAPNLGPKPNNLDSKPLYGPPIKDFSTHIKETPYIHFEKKPSYEVVESNDKIIEKPDGSKGYYAPDPDPSLPAPKIPPNYDPHSIPSHPNQNENFPTGQEYQILEAGPNVHAPIPNLSSQELFDLMHSFPNDQYTVVQSSNLPQPVLLGQQQYQPQQQILNQGYIAQGANSHQEVENHGQVQSSEVNHQQQPQQYQDFTHPHYQSFNYQENNPSSAAVPLDDYHNQFMFDPDSSASDNRNSFTVIRNTEEGNEGVQKKTESVKKILPNDFSNIIPDEDYDKDFDQDEEPSPIFKQTEPEVPFYSSLPNKETAEALATLQAAGSVASKINEMRGDQSPQEARMREVRVRYGLPERMKKPQKVNPDSKKADDEKPKDGMDKPKDGETTVEVQKSEATFEMSSSGKTLTDDPATELLGADGAMPDKGKDKDEAVTVPSAPSPPSRKYGAKYRRE